MKKLLLIVSCVLAMIGVDAQSIVPIRGDSIRIEKNNGNAELQIRNATRGRTGAFLQNRWNGTTQFAYVVDTAYRNAGGDSIVFWKGPQRWAVPAGVGSGGVTQLSNLTDVSISNLQVNQILKWNGSAWINADDQTGSAGGGITSLNTSTVASQSFQTGTTGTDFTISTNAGTGVHTFNLPTASATNRGLLSSTDWNTFNSKLSVESDPVWLAAAPNYYTITNLQTSGQSSVHWNNITNEPTFLTTETDPTAVKTAGSYANPSWITSLAWEKITGAPVYMAGTIANGQIAFGDGSDITGSNTFIYNGTVASYSLNRGSLYTDLSLIQKRYVDSLISAGTAATIWNGLFNNVSTVTGNVTLAAGQQYVYNGTSNGTFTLPARNVNSTRAYFIKNISAFNLTVQRAGTDVINTMAGDVTSITLTPGESRIIAGNGINWGAYGEPGTGGGAESDPVWSAAAPNYYTITNLQTSGQSSVHWNNITNAPAFITSYTETDPNSILNQTAGAQTANGWISGTLRADTRIQVNTANNTYPLEINGDARIGTNLRTTVNSNRLSLRYDANNGIAMVFGSGNGIQFVELGGYHFIQSIGSAITEQFVINAFTADKGLLLSTKAGTPTTISSDHIILNSLDTDATPPTTTGTTRIVIADAAGKLSTIPMITGGTDAGGSFYIGNSVVNSPVQFDSTFFFPNDSTAVGIAQGFQGSSRLSVTRNPQTGTFNGNVADTAVLYSFDIASIAGFISQGSNINITGAGTIASPFVINATGGGTTYTFGSSLNESGGTVTLDNDNNAPGNAYVYGTDPTTGTKGWQQSLPVVISSPSNGQVLKFNGTNWVNAADEGGAGSTYTFQKSIDEQSPGVVELLNDDAAPGNAKVYGTDPTTGTKGWQQSLPVVLSSPANGDVLKFNGTNWVNGTVSGGSQTLSQTLALGNTFSESIVMQNASAQTIGTFYNDGGVATLEMDDGVGGDDGAIITGIGTAYFKTSLRTDGERRLAVKTIPAATYTVLATDHYIELSEGTNTFNMVDPATMAGRELIIRNGFGSAWSFGASFRPINGFNTAITTIPANTVVHLVSNGTNWIIIN